MGIASFVVGLLVLMLSPFLNILLVLPAILGLFLGIIDCVIKSKKKAAKGFAVAGVVLSAIALVVCIVITGVKYFLYDSIAFSFDNNNETTSLETIEVAGIGDTVSLDNVNITLLSIDYNFTDYYSYAYVDDDCVIIKADFEFKNLGEYTEYISYSDFNCYADKFECDSFYSVEDAFFHSSLESGETGTGTVYFEVPKDAEKIQIEFSLIMYDDNKVIFESTFGDGAKN